MTQPDGPALVDRWTGHQADVLVVCRREPEPSGLDWQLPAGIVKPGATPSTVAVRETLAETGVHCAS